MLSNEEIREEIEQIGLENLLAQGDLQPSEFDDDALASMWNDASEAVQAIYRYMDLAGCRRDLHV